MVSDTLLRSYENASPNPQHAARGRPRPIGVLGSRPNRFGRRRPAKPYKILATTQIPAAGGIDYVTADSVNRRVYVACGNAVSIFDLDTYKLAGTLANASGHGVAIDPENHTGLVSRQSRDFFQHQDPRSDQDRSRRGCGRLYLRRPTHHFFILSHRAPNLLVVDSKDGSIVGKVDAIGPDGANAAVEQGVADGEGHLYFDVAKPTTSPWWTPKPSR